MSEQVIITQQQQPQQHKIKLRPSEIFYDAVRKNTRQIKHLMHDKEGGYCAWGLLNKYLIDGKDNTEYEPALIEIGFYSAMYWHKYHSAIADDNDDKGLTFKEFGDRFAVIGL